MKRILRSFILLYLLFASLPLQAGAAELLIPVGKVIGLQLQDDTLTVAAFDDVLGSCARDAGIKIGDELLKIDSTAVESVSDVKTALGRCGSQVALMIRRGGKISTLHLSPRQTEEGPRLGIYLRQGIAGIGTVTFYDPDTGLFGTLGHGVSDGRGHLLTMKQGIAYPAEVLSVRKGKCGEPGQLKGNADAVSTLGPLLKITPQGVFGITKIPWKPRFFIPNKRTSGCLRHHKDPLVRGSPSGGRLQRHPCRGSHHPLHSPGGYGSGVFCGNSEDLSRRPKRRPEFSDQSHRPGAAEHHRWYCAGHERQPDYSGWETGRRGYPCAGERPDERLWYLHRKHAGSVRVK